MWHFAWQLQIFMASCKIGQEPRTRISPPNMSADGNQVPFDKLPDIFAEFFDRKVVGIVEYIRVDQGVFNGHQKSI